MLKGDAHPKAPSMPEAFVVQWYPPDIQNAISELEALEWPVCGAEAQSVEEAVDSIEQTDPDVIVAWLDREPGKTRGLVLRYKTVAGGDGKPFVFVNGTQGAQEMLERVMPAGVFTDHGHLGAALKKAKKMT